MSWENQRAESQTGLRWMCVWSRHYPKQGDQPQKACGISSKRGPEPLLLVRQRWATEDSDKSFKGMVGYKPGWSGVKLRLEVRRWT